MKKNNSTSIYKTIGWVALVVVIVAVIIARSNTSAPSEVVSIAYTKKGEYLPMVVALQHNCFEKYGIRAKPVVVTGGIEAAEALSTGSADIALMGDVPSLISASSPNPGIIISAYASDENRHHLVVAPESNITEPKNLEGKKLAVQHGSSTHGGFLMYCAKHNVDTKKITMVKISPRDMPEAMASKQIDAMAGSQPWPSNVIKRNPQAQELDVFSGVDCNYPVLIVGTKNMVDERSKETSKVIKAFADAIEIIENSADECADLMASQSGMKPEDELRDLKNTTWGLTMDDKSIGGLKKMATLLHSEGILSKLPNWEQAISYEFVPQTLTSKN